MSVLGTGNQHQLFLAAIDELRRGARNYRALSLRTRSKRDAERLRARSRACEEEATQLEVRLITAKTISTGG